MRLAANISMLFTELPPLARIGAACEAGFDGVEFTFPYDLDPLAIRHEIAKHGTTLVQINTPKFGLAALPGREADFRAEFRAALTFLDAAGCSQLHVLAGNLPEGSDLVPVRETYVRNLQWAADEAPGVRLLIEPLNVVDMPSYALVTPEQAAAVITEVGRPNLGLQLDLYHAQIMGGELVTRIRQFAPLIRHVQLSSAPNRAEPDRGEVNLSEILQTLKDVGYDAWVSGEYKPTSTTRNSLGWMQLVAPFRSQAPSSSA